jgi:pimeloyl-ACP methyl ester carboxylesterase
MSESFEYERRPLLVVFSERSAFKETYGGEIDRIALQVHWLKPTRPSKTVLIFMHPVGGQFYLPMINAFAKAGCHVLVADSRYRGADSALIMEKVALDLGAVVREARERLGYERVVLAGWSGGGSLSLFYQAEAEDPQVRSTPAGEGPDLVVAGLPAADGVMLLAAHRSRHETLTEWMDASILDEADPGKRDQALDLYDPHAPNQPPTTPTSWVATGGLRSIATGGSPQRSNSGSRTSAPAVVTRTSGPSWSTAPWPIRAGSIPPSTRTTASQAGAIWATPGS